MTKTEDLLVSALRDEAARFEPAPGALARNVQRGARRRRRRIATGVAASVVFAVAVVTVTSRLGQLGNRGADSDATNPPSITVQRIAEAPLAPRERHSSVSVGAALFVWGGTAVTSAAPVATAGGSGSSFSNGAMYVPDTNTWRVVANAPLSARQDAPAVSFGASVLVIGGRDGTQLYRDGARYDVATDRWTRIADPPVCGQQATMVGRRVYVWGVCDGIEGFASYDPTADTWSSLPVPAIEGVTQLLSWQGRVVAFGTMGDAAAFDVGAGRWTKLPALPGSTAAEGPSGAILDAIAATDGQRLLAVAGHSERGGSVVFINVGTGWQAVAARDTQMPMGEDGRALVSASTLIWTSSTGLEAFSTDPPRSRSVKGRPGGVPVARSSLPSLHEVAPGRVVIWGGRTVDDSRYADDGVSSNQGLTVSF